MLFLVQGEVVRSDYMRDSTRSETVMKLVEAEYDDEAVKKFKDHWEVNSSFGSVHYHVNVHDCSEVIK